MFDPKAQHSDGGESVPAGEYMMAVTALQLKKSKAGKAYARLTIEVCSGQYAGKTFYASQSLAETSYGRLSVWCASMGVTEPFELTDERALRQALSHKPFKAKIKVTQNGEYVNHDIERFVTKLSPTEQKAAESWVMDLAEREALGESGQDDDEPPF